MQWMNEAELTKKSQAFRDFYKSLRSLQDSDPRDGLQIDSSALLALAGDDRSEAENLLIERIQGIGGPVIHALAALKSQRGAIALKELAQKAGGSDAAEIALGLWKIERWPSAETVLIDVLEGRRKYFSDENDEGLSEFESIGRADAARALGEIPGPRAKEALRRALNDPDFLVRHWAQVSLDRCGVEGVDSDASRPTRRWWQFWNRPR